MYDFDTIAPCLLSGETRALLYFTFTFASESNQ